MYIVYWSSYNKDSLKVTNHNLSVKSCEELINLILSLNETLKESSPLIQIVLPKSDVLIIGLGSNNRSVLMYNSINGQPPYFVSVNPENIRLPEDNSVIFYLDNHETEISEKHIIPFDIALKGLEYFLTTEKLTKEIQWEEV
jgi:hypothetical protein